MAVIVDGIVGSGVAVPGNDFITVTFDLPVLRSRPTQATHLFIVSTATSAAKAVFGASAVDDSAGTQACYGSLYGTGNLYERLLNVGIARDLTASPPIHSEDHEIWTGCILHDIAVGDTLTVAYESGSALTWGRAAVLAVHGLLASPAPFPAGWWQGFGWGWNRFWSLYAGNTATCFKAVPDNSEFMGAVPADGRTHWTTSCLWALQNINVKAATASLSSWTWADGAVIDYEYENQGPDNVSQVLGHYDLSSPAGDLSPDFGGCWNVAPTFHANESHDVFAGIFCEGLGPAYDNPGACAGGVIVSERFKAKLPIA